MPEEQVTDAKVTVVETDGVFVVSAMNSTGSSQATVVSESQVAAAAMAALAFAGHGTQPVQLVAPEWIKAELGERGFRL